ncbi:hypothetical protein CVT26_007014 [Gymnopilus dilepis]|uniref:Uncharacterized protein n=1 Tax=Gymnopilus dilepis TaxID=231916 RepID=A0A409W025_9AGAR|nr:hypothetical protein CVT26_007014 [Gymnopilus dilepis]
MPLQDGLYQIRWVPKGIKLPFLGGVYATGDIKHSPVRAEALGPEAGNQKWNISAVDGKENTYTISYPGIVLTGGEQKYGDRTDVTSWTSSRKIGHTEPVILGNQLEEWVITVVDEEYGVYRISEPHEVVGAVRYVTEENDLVRTPVTIFYGTKLTHDMLALRQVLPCCSGGFFPYLAVGSVVRLRGWSLKCPAKEQFLQFSSPLYLGYFSNRNILVHIHNMSLKAGLYQIRFVPKHVQCPFKGGQYATSTTINAPIRAEPHQSGASDQTWQVEQVQGQKGTYRITFPTLPEGPGVSHTSTGIVLPGWGVADRTRTPSDPVLLSVDIKEWVITATDAANNVFRLV